MWIIKQKFRLLLWSNSSTDKRVRMQSFVIVKLWYAKATKVKKLGFTVVN